MIACFLILLFVTLLIVTSIAQFDERNVKFTAIGVEISILVLITIFSTVKTVPTGKVGVVTTFGKVEDRVPTPGVNIVAPWQNISTMNVQVQKSETSLSCFTKDLQEVDISYSVNYQLLSSKAREVYSSVGTKYEAVLLDPNIQEAVKDAAAKYTAENLVASRSELAMTIENDLVKRLDGSGLVIASTSIENIDFTDQYTDAIEAKQVAQQNALKAEEEAKQKRVAAQAEADAKLISAKADAEALTIAAEAQADANDTLSKSLTPEILQKLYYETWDGKLPSVMGGDTNTVMVPMPTPEE